MSEQHQLSDGTTRPLKVGDYVLVVVGGYTGNRGLVISENQTGAIISFDDPHLHTIKLPHHYLTLLEPSGFDTHEQEGFVVKDSGQRKEFAGGMVRDVADGKTNYALIFDGPMFARWAEHLTKGAKKYSPRNWMKATGQEEQERFKESAFRHFVQWFRGDTDEDHAAAVYFNINGFEYMKRRENDETTKAA